MITLMKPNIITLTKIVRSVVHIVDILHVIYISKCNALIGVVNYARPADKNYT